jgi:hypothetical protein
MGNKIPKTTGIFDDVDHPQKLGGYLHTEQKTLFPSDKI